MERRTLLMVVKNAMIRPIEGESLMTEVLSLDA